MLQRAILQSFSSAELVVAAAAAVPARQGFPRDGWVPFAARWRWSFALRFVPQNLVPQLQLQLLFVL